MKTTIDLPESVLHRAKIVAAQRKTTLKQLVLLGLDWVIRSGTKAPDPGAARARLQKGLRLGGERLSRAESHERH